MGETGGAGKALGRGGNGICGGGVGVLFDHRPVKEPDRRRLVGSAEEGRASNSASRVCRSWTNSACSLRRASCSAFRVTSPS